MIAVDTNLLVYAHRSDSPHHARASDHITSLAEGIDPWAIPWPCIHEFFSIVTHPRIYSPPTPAARALDQLTAWLESPTLVLLGEGRGYFDTLKDLAKKAKVTGPQIHDARIAALCRSHGVTELHSADRDFHRFSNLRVKNPLKP
ncbi:MAG: TA system VapC family ribonuclease toxin [Polyangiaceae bacterium]